MTTPVIYDLKNTADASRFGLTRSRADFLMGQSNARSQWGAKPKVIVLHVQDGNTPGSLGWWIDGWVNGEKVQASSTVTIQRDGSILRVLDEATRAPWTNGDVQSPTAQSKYLRSLGGYIGAWCLTIEFEGQHGQPLTAAQLASGIWQVEEWEKTWGIPHTKDTVLPHSAINSVTRANCPSDVIYNAVYNGITEHPGASTETYSKTEPLPQIPKAYNLLTRTVTIKPTGANRRKFATLTAGPTGPVLEAGQKVKVLYTVQGDNVDGESRWWVTEDGSRVWVGATEEKP